LEALAADLVEATDDEVMQAAKDLSMNPQMKGSAVFAGIKYPAKPRLSDFYDTELEANLPAALRWRGRQPPRD
jgi:hypothetical protein